jgi:hypothetical protein
MSLTMTRKTIKGPAVDRSDTPPCDPDLYRGTECPSRNHGQTTSSDWHQEPSMIMDLSPGTSSRRAVVDSGPFEENWDLQGCELRPLPVLNSMELKSTIFSSRRKSTKCYYASVQNIISRSSSESEELSTIQPSPSRKQARLVNCYSNGASRGEGSDEDNAMMFFEGKRFFSLYEEPQSDDDAVSRRFSRI